MSKKQDDICFKIVDCQHSKDVEDIGRLVDCHLGHSQHLHSHWKRQEQPHGHQEHLMHHLQYRQRSVPKTPGMYVIASSRPYRTKLN